MKNCIVLILLLAPFFSAFGQYGKDRYVIDSFQLFSLDELTYEFNLRGPIQGLYFDSIIYSTLPHITLKIINNTTDTIFKRYKEQDDHLMWLRAGGSCGLCDTMLPNDYFELHSAWGGYKHGYGPFNTTIDVQYQNKGSGANCRIHTWGELYPEGYNFNKDTIESKEVEARLYSGKSDSITISDSVEGLYYYNWSEKQQITPDNTGLYTYHVFKRDLEATGLGLDSIKSLLRSKNLYHGFSKPSASIITSEEDYYYTFKCTPKEVQEIKNILKGIEIHLTIRMGSNPTYLDDSYLIFFNENADLDENNVIDILMGKGVSNYEFIPKTKVRFPRDYSYLIKIRLGNDQLSNLRLIEDLMNIPEVSWVTSGRQSYDCYD